MSQPVYDAWGSRTSPPVVLSTATSVGRRSANTNGKAKDLQVSTRGASLYTVSAFNASGTDLYLQAFDASAEPADGTAPKLVTPVYQHSSGGFNFPVGKDFTYGIYLCVSTTDATKSRVSVDSAMLDAEYQDI